VRNAQAMAAAFAGLGKRYRVLTGGTDNHMVMIDISGTGKTGLEIENMLGEQEIYVNKNFIPYDPLPVTQTSGIRLGSPLLTTLGANEQDMARVVELIDAAISGKNVADSVQTFMGELAQRQAS
jgi:glycine hydroxymethyltransferase